LVIYRRVSANDRQDDRQKDGADQTREEDSPRKRRVQDDLATTRFFGRSVDEAKEWRDTSVRASLESPEKAKGFNGVFGRGTRIRTLDLQYPKLPRYQAALYPDRLRNDVDTRLSPDQQGAARRFIGH
jgi:hypothetical protein